MINLYHSINLSKNQCSSRHIQTIKAPLHLVWSIVRRFDNPQAYKNFIKKCTITAGNGGVGSIREIMVISGLPAETSIERLDELDDDAHIMRFSIIGGDHRLQNYCSKISVHEEAEQRGISAVVIESYVVDVPPGSNEEDTCSFADTIVNCNLKSLANIAEKLARNTPNN